MDLFSDTLPDGPIYHTDLSSSNNRRECLYRDGSGNGSARCRIANPRVLVFSTFTAVDLQVYMLLITLSLGS